LVNSHSGLHYWLKLILLLNSVFAAELSMGWVWFDEMDPRTTLICCASCLVYTVNVALGKPAVQSSTWQTTEAWRAVDGNINTPACTLASPEPWWSVDLGAAMDVARVEVKNGYSLLRG